MTKENKELVAIDVCGRIHSNVVFRVGEYNYIVCGYMSTDTQPIKAYFFKDTDGDRENPIYIQFPLKSYKPYLRPLGSMTDEETVEFRRAGGVISYDPVNNTYAMAAFSADAYDWLNKNHFDFRGMIERGLAIEVTEENNPYNS